MCCEEGGTLQTNTTGVCGECSQCMDHTGFAPAHGSVYFLGLHCSGSRLLCRGTVQSGPGLVSLPMCKLFRFSFLSTPQRHRLSWVCLLYPSQVWEAQAIRCLASALSQVCSASYHLPSPSLSVSWVSCKSTVSCVPCVSSGGWSQAMALLADVDHPGSQEDMVSNLLSVWWRMLYLWCTNCVLPSSSGCLPPASLPPVGRWASPQPPSSSLIFSWSFVLWAGQAVA